MSFSITVDVLCPKIVAKFYVHPLDFSHGILRERGLGGEGVPRGTCSARPLYPPAPFSPKGRKGRAPSLNRTDGKFLFIAPEYRHSGRTP